MVSVLQSVLVMSNKTQILQELYNTQFVENYLKTFVRSNDIDFVQDEIQDIYLIVGEMNEERLKGFYDKGGINAVRRFVAGVIYRQMNSTTSKIHALYRKRQSFISSTNGMTTDQLEKGKNKLDNLYK